MTSPFVIFIDSLIFFYASLRVASTATLWLDELSLCFLRLTCKIKTKMATAQSTEGRLVEWGGEGRGDNC